MKGANMSKRWLSVLGAVGLMAFSNAVLASFTVDVYINGAGSPSLQFGEASTAVAKPAVPSALSFGVHDVYLAGSGSGDYARLSTDLRKASAGNKWILVSNSNTTVKFQTVEGTLPTNFKAAWYENGDVVTMDVTDGATLTVKQNTAYTILATSSTTVVPEANPAASQTVYVSKATDYSGELDSEGDLALAKNATVTVTYNLVAGTASIAMDAAANADWTVAFAANDDSFTLTNVAFDDYKLTATLKAKAAIAEAPVYGTMTFTANRSGLPAITAYGTAASGENSEKLADLMAVVLSEGSLDFDGSGVVDGKDAMYLYNFISAGKPPMADDEDEEWDNVSGLLDYTGLSADSEADFALAQTAIGYFRANEDALDFDGNGNVDGKDAMYLYNFVAAGKPPMADDEDEELDNVKGLLDYTGMSADDEANIQTARNVAAKLREFNAASGN